MKTTYFFTESNRRTNQAEAVRDALQAAGYQCSIYYQMD